MAQQTRKQVIELAQKIYGKQDKRISHLENIFNQTQSAVINEIKAFISDDKNWTSNASQKDIDNFMSRLKEITDEATDDNKTLIKTAYNNQKLVSNGDLLFANITASLVVLGSFRKNQLEEATTNLPSVAKATNYTEAKKIVDKPIVKSTTSTSDSLSTIMQRSASNAVSSQSFEQSYSDINKQTLDTIRRVRDVAERAVKKSANPIDFEREVAEIMTGGDKATKGALGRAEGMIRTMTAKVFNQNKVEDYANRGVTQYKFLSLEDSTTCDTCSELDGKVFDVNDIQEGVNYPPMHYNCQCDTEEITTNDNYSTDIPSDDELTKELNNL